MNLLHQGHLGNNGSGAAGAGPPRLSQPVTIGFGNLGTSFSSNSSGSGNALASKGTTTANGGGGTTASKTSLVRLGNGAPPPRISPPAMWRPSTEARASAAPGGVLFRTASGGSNVTGMAGDPALAVASNKSSSKSPDLAAAIANPNEP